METMTKNEQKILNARIRLALRTGDLPFTFVDKHEKNYRKIVWKMGKDLNKKFTVNKRKSVWTISLA